MTLILRVTCLAPSFPKIGKGKKVFPIFSKTKEGKEKNGQFRQIPPYFIRHPLLSPDSQTEAQEAADLKRIDFIIIFSLFILFIREIVCLTCDRKSIGVIFSPLLYWNTVGFSK